jgi:ATP-dependent Clp protease adaptor protein ClpS
MSKRITIQSNFAMVCKEIKINLSRYQVEPKESAVELLIPQYHVLLYNDSINTMDFVTSCLIQVFGFTQIQAWAIMYEAHTNGIALCATEPLELAELHCDRLISLGLNATIEEEAV